MVKDLTYLDWSLNTSYWFSIINKFDQNAYDTGVHFKPSLEFDASSITDDLIYLQLLEAQIACGLIPLSMLYPDPQVQSTLSGVIFYKIDSQTNELTLNNDISIVDDQICVPTSFTSQTIFNFWAFVRTETTYRSLYFQVNVLAPSSFYAVYNVQKIEQLSTYAGGADGSTQVIRIPFSIEFLTILSNDFSGNIPQEIAPQLHENLGGVYQAFESSYISIVESTIELSTSFPVTQTLYLMKKVTNTTAMFYLPVEFTVCAYTHYDEVIPHQIILEVGGDSAYEYTDLKVIDMFELNAIENCQIQSISLVQDETKGDLKKIYSDLVSFDETKSDFLVFDLSEAVVGYYSLYALGITDQDLEVLTPIMIELFSYVQKPPYFTEELGEFMVEVKQDDQLAQSFEIFQYDSPLLEDPEGDMPIIEFEEDLGHEALSCESKDHQFSCYVDSSKVTEENAGRVEIRIQVYDMNIPMMNYLIVFFAISITFIATKMSQEELDTIQQEIAAQEEAEAALLADQEAEALLMQDESIASLFPNIDGESSARRAERIRQFQRTQELVGTTFPGVDQAQLDAMLAAMEEAEQSGEVPLPPSMSIEPMTPSGEQSIVFNQEMLVPQDTSTLDYSSIFEFIVISAVDQSENKAIYLSPFEADNRRRFLKEEDFNQQSQSSRRLAWITVEPPRDVNYWDTQPFYPEGHVKELVQTEAQKNLGSSFYLVQHDPEIISFQFQFDYPDKVSSSTYGSDSVKMVIKNLELFKSGKSGQGIDLSTFESGSPEISASLPSIIADEEQIQSVNESTDFIGKLTNFVSGGNFVISLILGGSMQYLWGFIRVMQMIILYSTVNINYPSHTIAFFQGAVVFASMDILSGESLYEQIFEFKETDPLNERFEAIDIGDKNFIMNSGSFLVLNLLIVADFYIRRFINFVCIKFAKFRFMRKIAITFHEHRQEESEMYQAALKLFLESYFDLCMAITLGIWAFFEEPLSNFKLFWDSPDNIFSSVLTIGIAIGIFVFPYWVYTKILEYAVMRSLQTGKNLDVKYADLFFEGISPHSINSQLYQFYFMMRRLFIPVLLIIFNQTHALQLASMIIFSILNLGYLIAVMPFRKNLDNYIEMFNEITILMVAHFVWSLLNNKHQISVRLKLGWALIYSTCANMGINLLIVLYYSSNDVYSSSRRYCLRRQRQNDLETQLFDTKYTTRSEDQIALLRAEYQAYNFCMEYMPQRRWCLRNNIDISSFQDEIQYQVYEKEFMFRRKAQMILVQKAIISASITLEEEASKKRKEQAKNISKAKKSEQTKTRMQKLREIQKEPEENNYYEEFEKEDVKKADQSKKKIDQKSDPIKSQIMHMFSHTKQMRLKENSKKLKVDEILELSIENRSSSSSEISQVIDSSVIQKAADQIKNTETLVFVEPRKEVNLINRFSKSYIDNQFDKIGKKQAVTENKPEFLNVEFMHEDFQQELKDVESEIIDHLKLSEEEKEQQMIEVHQSRMTLFDDILNQVSVVLQFLLELKPLKKFFIKNELSKLIEGQSQSVESGIASDLENIFKKAFGYQISGCEYQEMSVQNFSDKIFQQLKYEQNVPVMEVFDGIINLLVKAMVPQKTPKLDIATFLDNEGDRTAQVKIVMKSFPSVIQRIFTGIYESTEWCQEHDMAKPVYNLFSQNQIELDMSHSLGFSLKKYFGVEEAFSTRFCQVCKKETEHKCVISAHLLPPILAFQVDRYDGEKQNKSEFNYPPEINFMSSFSEVQEPIYELMGVISNRFDKNFGQKHVCIVQRKSGETILFDAQADKPQKIQKDNILKDIRNVEMLFYRRQLQ